MKTDNELFEWLEDERRKYALAFSVDYRKYVQKRIPRVLTMLLPLLLVGFVGLLLVQHNRISELETNNTELSKELVSIKAQTDWYRAEYEQALNTSVDAPGEPGQGDPSSRPQRYRRSGQDAFSLDYWQAP